MYVTRFPSELGLDGQGQLQRPGHGVQRRMVLVDNFFNFLELNLFAYLLLHLP